MKSTLSITAAGQGQWTLTLTFKTKQYVAHYTDAETIDAYNACGDGYSKGQAGRSRKAANALRAYCRSCGRIRACACACA